MEWKQWASMEGCLLFHSKQSNWTNQAEKEIELILINLIEFLRRLSEIDLLWVMGASAPLPRANSTPMNSKNSFPLHAPCSFTFFNKEKTSNRLNSIELSSFLLIDLIKGLMREREWLSLMGQQRITNYAAIKEIFDFFMEGATNNSPTLSSHQSTKTKWILFLFDWIQFACWWIEWDWMKIYYNSNLRLLKYLNNAESAIV